MNRYSSYITIELRANLKESADSTMPKECAAHKKVVEGLPVAIAILSKDGSTLELEIASMELGWK